MPSLPVRAAKLSTVSPKSGAKQPRRETVRQTAKSALLAAGLAIGPLDGETPSPWRLFDAGLLDRLSPPVTRFHD